MRRFCSCLASLLCVLLLTQCVTSGPRTLHLTTTQIQQKLNQSVSQPLTLMKVFQVQLSNAVVALDPASQRMHTLLDVAVQGPLLAHPLQGQLDISGELRYDPSQQAVILDNARLDQLHLLGADDKLNQLAQGLSKQLSNQWLRQLVLYQVKPEALKVGGTSYLPSTFHLTADGVSITLLPQQ